MLLAVPGITPADLTAIASISAGRAAGPAQALQPVLDRLKPYLAVSEPSVFMISVRLLAGPGIIAQGTADAVVQVAGNGPLPFRTLQVSNP